MYLFIDNTTYIAYEYVVQHRVVRKLLGKLLAKGISTALCTEMAQDLSTYCHIQKANYIFDSLVKRDCETYFSKRQKTLQVVI